MDSVYKRAAEAEISASASAVCIVVSTRGSTPRKPGAKMIVYKDGSLFGSVGGGNFEKGVISRAMEVIQNGEPFLLDADLKEDHSMECSGSMQVYIEPVTASPSLYIFGAGHIGRELAWFAAAIGFTVTLIDDRKEVIATVPPHPSITMLPVHFTEAFSSLPFSDQTYIVSLSHLHESDRDIVAWCARQPHKYLGMIGSRRKIATIKDYYLTHQILKEEEMINIDWPIGLDLGGDKPAEIAIAIVAKMIAVKYGKST